MAAQGGVCLSSTDRWQLGTDSGTEPVCSTQEMFQYNIKTKARPTSGWGRGGGPSAAHPSRSKDFSSLLDSSHPSEKVLLLPVFYETPTHQPSNCSQHVLWFYVSNKKQLHLHKNLLLLEQIKSKGVERRGGKASLSVGMFFGLPYSPDGTAKAQRHQEMATSQQFFCLLLPE